MSERVYGSEENVRRELQGNTSFEKEIEDILIKRIATIEKNNGVVPALNRADWIALWVITGISLIGIIYSFVII